MKNLCLILFLTTLSLNLFAQSDEPKIYKFGIKAGVNYSLMNFNKAFFPPSPTVKNVWKPGFNVGGLLQLHLNDRFTLQPEYAFTMMNSEDPRINTSYSIGYLSLPLLLKFSVFEKLSVLAGPQFDLLVTAREKSNGVSGSIEHQTEERGISGVCAVEYDVYKAFFLDARYLMGFNHVGIQRSDINEFKWGLVGVAVGFHF